MAGPWSSGSVIGNSATFCTQSGGVSRFASGQYYMNGDRWSANWPTKGGPNRSGRFPLSLASKGVFAAMHFYKTVKTGSSSEVGQGLIGVQTGKILSVGKKASTNANAKDIGVANDGDQTDTNAYWSPGKVPFTYQIDLGSQHVISQVDLNTRMLQGSETFYSFILSASTDGKDWDDLADQSDNVDVGFVATYSNSTTKYRHVRIAVDDLVKNTDGDSAKWAAGIVEMTVYGQQRRHGGKWKGRTEKEHEGARKCSA